MLFAILFYLLLVIISSIYISKSDKRSTLIGRKKVLKSYINWIIILLILITGLRNISVGPDTVGYYIDYGLFENMDWNQVIKLVTDYYNYGIGKDVGYDVLKKSLQTIDIPFRLFLFLVAILFFVPYGQIMKKLEHNTTAAFYAFLMFIALFLIYAFSSIRQDIAISATLIAFKFVCERKLIWFLLIVIIASTIHKSALLFIPYYWIANISRVKTMATITAVILPLLFIFARPIGLFLAQTSGQDVYLLYVQNTTKTAGTPILTFLLIGCFILYLISIPRLKEQNPKHYLYTNTIYLSVGLLPITWIDSNLVRTLLYFIIFLPIIISNCLVLSPHSYRRYITTIYILLISFFFISTFPPYDFFWNSMPMGENYSTHFNTQGI